MELALVELSHARVLPTHLRARNCPNSLGGACTMPYRPPEPLLAYFVCCTALLVNGTSISIPMKVGRRFA